MQKQKFQKLLKIINYNFFINFFLFFFLITNLLAIELKGNYIQGGLIIGKTDSNLKIFLDDTPIPVDKNGYFLFGFDRKHAASSILKIIFSTDKIVEKKLLIKNREYQIQKINNLDENKVVPPKAFYERIKKEIAIIKKAKKINIEEAYYKKGFIMPAKGVITGVYGSQRILNGKPRRPHYGLDIANKKGTPVLASSDGIIVLAEKDLYFSGGTIIMSHGQGLTSSFLHLSAISVKVGDKVIQGQVIGSMGATGRATGSHLDWRMEIRGVRIDPRLLLK